METKGSVTIYLLLVLLLLAGGYLINKGIITVNLDKVDLPSTTTTSSVLVSPSTSSGQSPSTTKELTTTTTTVPEEEICKKNGTNFQMSLKEAKDIALHSECGEKGNLTNVYFCNKGTGTWWIDLDIQKKGCSPACVINVETKKAEINWRCTGLIVPEH